MVRLSLLLLITIPMQLLLAHASTADTAAQTNAPRRLQDQCITYLANNFSQFDHESIGFRELDQSDLQRVLSSAANDRRNALDICRYKEECPERLLRTAELVSGETFGVDKNNNLDAEFVIDKLQLTDPELLEACASLRELDLFFLDLYVINGIVFSNPAYRMHIFKQYILNNNFHFVLKRNATIAFKLLSIDSDMARQAYYNDVLKKIFDDKCFDGEDRIKYSVDSTVCRPFVEQFISNHKLSILERMNKTLVANGRPILELSKKYLAKRSIKNLRETHQKIIRIAIANSKNEILDIYEFCKPDTNVFGSVDKIMKNLREFLHFKFGDLNDE